MKFLRKHRNVVLRIIDVLIIAVSYYIAQVIISSKLTMDRKTLLSMIDTIVIATIIYSFILTIFKTYKNITRYENGNDYVLACVIAGTVMIILNKITTFLVIETRINLIAELIIVVALISYRVFIRMILNHNYENRKASDDRKNVLVVGAGDATRQLLTTIKNSLNWTYNVVGLVDDNANKVNYAISGNKILGTRYDIPRICKEKNVELIFFAISNISTEDRRKILEICQETGCKVRILPGTKDLIKNKSLMQNFRDVEIEDLLGRDPIKLDNKSNPINNRKDPKFNYYYDLIWKDIDHD